MTLIVEKVNGDWHVRRAPADYEPADADHVSLTLEELFQKAAEEMENSKRKEPRHENQ